VVLHRDLARVQWSKLLVNLNNSLNALSGVPIREQLSDLRYRKAMSCVVREALGCLNAAGIKPIRIGRLIPKLAPAVLSLPDWLFFRVAAAMVKIDPAARSSMWQDLERGRPTEVDYLNGEIVRLGEKHGVPTPVNRAVCELVHAAERAGKGSPRLAAGELLAAITRDAAA
jgi:2-dehydropantoate 2-reductase